LSRAGAQQSEAKNCATVGVNATRGGQHARLCLLPQALQGGKRLALPTGLRHAGEIVAQRKQATKKSAAIHVLMTAIVTKRNQSGFRLQCQFGIQGTHGGAADRVRPIHHGVEGHRDSKWS
jgi:hypothetical protein